MLAGLLIATHDADDRPGMLTATLPFGGATLIEYQARLLVGAGASQLVVMVARLTPDLLGALGRMGKRGVAVDTVRSAAEAAEKLHPLARVVLLADGLTTTADVVAGMAREGGDALLVVGEDDEVHGYERVGGGMAWAGVARLDPRRIAELAALPRDYDIQSTLVRLASQARAMHVMLAPDAVRRGHAIDHRAATLTVRGHSVLTAAVVPRGGWFDRLVTGPLARVAVPMLVPRHVPVMAFLGGGGLAGALGLAAAWSGHPGIGLVASLAGAVTLSLAAIFATVRDEPGPARTAAVAAAVLPGLAVLLVGRTEMAASGNGAAPLLAVSLVMAAALGERALGGGRPGWWWGSPAAYLALAALFAMAGTATLGLGAATLYAIATLAAAVERLRQTALGSL